MNVKTPAIAAAAIAMSALCASAETETGMMQLQIDDRNGSRQLDGFMWYPTDASEGATRALGNAVWESISVIPNAEPTAGKKPLVVLSHGMFGNARNQAWLADALTAEGYLVAAVDHPGTTTFNRDPAERKALWERPKDISRTIDHILTMDTFGEMVDPDRIYMAGHSLGGWTAIGLAGGRYDAATFERYCENTPQDLVCGIFSSWQIGKTAEDRDLLAQDVSDPRIKGFAVFDLGGTQTFATESLAAISKPMIIYGAPIENAGVNLDVESRALITVLPEGAFEYHEPADFAHFDFLGVCTDMALSILKEEEPDDVMVCENGTEARRAKHSRIANEVSAFFLGLE